MINGRQKQERPRSTLDAEREELQQATRRFIRSVVRTGVRVALFPLSSLPRQPQQHFRAAGRELTYGLTTLIHGLANGLEERVKESTPSTPLEEGPHPEKKSD